MFIPNIFSSSWIARQTPDRDVCYLKYKMSNPFSLDLRMHVLYQTIIGERAQDLLEPNPQCFEGQNPMGECLNIFRQYSECSCPPLNRKVHPELRAQYESRAIELIQEQSLYTNELTLTFFASGYLFGELVLLTKILEALRDSGWQGKLNLHFIDSKYAAQDLEEKRTSETTLAQLQQNVTISKTLAYGGAAIGGGASVAVLVSNPRNRANQVGSALLAIGAGACYFGGNAAAKNAQEALESAQAKRWKEKFAEEELSMKLSDTEAAVKSLMIDLKWFVPFGIKIGAKFFGNSVDYLSLCGLNSKHRSDFLFGSDTDDTRQIFDDLIEKTQKSLQSKALLLWKAQSGGVYLSQMTGNSRKPSTVKLANGDEAAG